MKNSFIPQTTADNIFFFFKLLKQLQLSLGTAY